MSAREITLNWRGQESGSDGHYRQGGKDSNLFRGGEYWRPIRENWAEIARDVEHGLR